MRVELRKVGREAHEEVRRMADERGCNLRAPHFTVSQAGLIAELAISAGGILLLDEVDEFRVASLVALRNTLGMMQDKCRPTLVLTHGEDGPKEVGSKMVAFMRAWPGDEG